jgi:transcriptional regulator with XRE-family HTH domain
MAGMGRRLRRLREVHNLTQAAIARRCGVSTPAWNHWETGENGMMWQRAGVVARALGVTVEWIYFGVSDRLPEKMRTLLEADDDPGDVPR